MELQIPKAQQATLLEFARLSAEAKQALLEALKTESGSLKIQDTAQAFSDRSGLPINSAAPIVWMLHNMYSSRASSEVPVDEFADAVLRATVAFEPSGSRLTDDERNGARNFLKEALSMDDTFGVSAKALSVSLDQERLFTECRILSDIRPVFGDDIDSAPKATVIIHKLRINYNEGGELRHFYVSLDAEDLEALKSSVERALKKDAGLKAFLKGVVRCLS
ncbi:MAG TPA: hypothetical protein VGO11_23510 [Chthoniobacteraceae bacterium]|jgi:hypothetical protein|nr:hypothetical protein [Chthoniobacteraceae bacterium]